jgi:predicted enzyme related to lactoylglutathione lyase
MSRVVHFEIHVENPERAMRFYSAVFQWEFTKWGGPWDYWMIKTGEEKTPGINGGLLKRQGAIDGQAVIAYVCTVDVADVDQCVQSITANGGTIALPKMPIPGVGWLAYAKDTEGNLFGIMQSEPEEK